MATAVNAMRDATIKSCLAGYWITTVCSPIQRHIVSYKQAVRPIVGPPHYAPARCMPDVVAQLQPIPYDCDAQRSLLPIAVGTMNINDLMNINDVREFATIFPRPCKFTFDLESGVWVTCDVGYLCQFWSS